MDPSIQLSSWARLHQNDPVLLIKEIQKDVIASPFINNPLFGKKKSIYTDFFASSKPLHKFESIMLDKVLPFYANTHTTSTSTSKYTTTSVKLARETISRCTNTITTSGHEHEAAVIFCGSGSTSAICKVRNVFHLADKAYWIRKAKSRSANEIAVKTTACTSKCCSNDSEPVTGTHLDPKDRPVVFLSIQEHHSNLLPWRESCADVIVIPENEDTHMLDLEYLETQLILHQHRPLKLGTFSAGSNLTGVLNDTIKISELLHSFGAFAFYDYAGVGPYTTIDMNPNPRPDSRGKNLAYKDGIFISTHKFLGGPGSTGVLLARLEIFGWCQKNSGTNINEYVPVNPGGGTVDMVIQDRHKFTNDVLAREEAGTPNILATIRAGLVFQLQDIIGPSWVLEKEYKLAKSIMERLLAPKLNGTIDILGASDRDRVAVFSVNIIIPNLLSYDRKQPLRFHHKLMSIIMNDFFGIEMRDGCMCAGPYASKLLRFDADKEAAFWKLLIGQDKDFTLTQKQALYLSTSTNNDTPPINVHQMNISSKSLKPGFVRFSFSYFAASKDVEFVLQALEWMAQYGYLLIPLYKLNAKSGEWSVRDAVHRAVINEIPSKLLNDPRRKNCIPIANRCVHALEKLFKKQVELQKLQEPESLYSRSEIYNASNSSLPDTQIVPTPRQTNKNWIRRLSVSLSMTGVPTTRPSSEYTREDGGIDVIVTGDDSNNNLTENSSRSTRKLNHSSYASSFNSNRSDMSFSARRKNYISSPSSLSTAKTTMTMSIPKPSLREKKSGIFSTLRKSPHKIEQFILEALDELSLDLLQSEINYVESSKLAKELRWFASPLDVAKLYQTHASNPVESLLSFPK